MALDKDTLLMATLRKVQKIGKRLRSIRTSNKAGFCKEIDSRDLEKTGRTAIVWAFLCLHFTPASGGPLFVGLLSWSPDTIRFSSVTVDFSYLSVRGMGEHEMRDKETTATTLVGKIRLNGALAGKEEPLHSWVPRSNHELDGQQQQQVNLVPTAVYSNFVYKPRSNRQHNLLINVIVNEM